MVGGRLDGGVVSGAPGKENDNSGVGSEVNPFN